MMWNLYPSLLVMLFQHGSTRPFHKPTVCWKFELFVHWDVLLRTTEKTLLIARGLSRKTEMWQEKGDLASLVTLYFSTDMYCVNTQRTQYSMSYVTWWNDPTSSINWPRLRWRLDWLIHVYFSPRSTVSNERFCERRPASSKNHGHTYKRNPTTQKRPMKTFLSIDRWNPSPHQRCLL